VANRVLPAVVAASVGVALIVWRTRIAEIVIYYQSRAPWGRLIGERALPASRLVILLCGIGLVVGAC
jgi:hypothetical protein